MARQLLQLMLVYAVLAVESPRLDLGVLVLAFKPSCCPVRVIFILGKPLFKQQLFRLLPAHISACHGVLYGLHLPRVVGLDLLPCQRRGERVVYRRHIPRQVRRREPYAVGKRLQRLVDLPPRCHVPVVGDLRRLFKDAPLQLYGLLPDVIRREYVVERRRAHVLVLVALQPGDVRLQPGDLSDDRQILHEVPAEKIALSEHGLRPLSQEAFIVVVIPERVRKAFHNGGECRAARVYGESLRQIPRALLPPFLPAVLPHVHSGLHRRVHHHAVAQRRLCHEGGHGLARLRVSAHQLRARQCRVHDLAGIDDLPEQIRRFLFKLFALKPGLRRGLHLARYPQPAPGLPVAELRKRHGFFNELVLPALVMPDLIPHPAGKVGVHAADILPHARPGVLHHFLVCVLIREGLEQILRLYAVRRSHVACRLQSRNPQVCPHGCRLVVAHELGIPPGSPVAVFRLAVDVLHQRLEVVERFIAEGVLHGVLRRAHVVHPVSQVDPLLVAEPFDRVQDRQAQSVELCHVRHVLGEGVKDVPHDQRVGCPRVDCLARRYVQQPEHAVLLRVGVRHGPLCAACLDGVVPRPLVIEVIAPAPHADLVAPLGPLLCHVSLQGFGNRKLSLGQKPCHGLQVLHAHVVAVRAAAHALFGLHVAEAYAAALDVLHRLLAPQQHRKLHDLRRRHLHLHRRLAPVRKLDLVRLLLPGPHLLRRVCLLGEVDHLPRVEGHLLPALCQRLENGLSALAVAPHRVIRGHALPCRQAEELALFALAGLAQLLHVPDVVVRRVLYTAEPVVCKEAVHVVDGLGHVLQELVEHLQLLRQQVAEAEFSALLLHLRRLLADLPQEVPDLRRHVKQASQALLFVDRLLEPEHPLAEARVQHVALLPLQLFLPRHLCRALLRPLVQLQSLQHVPDRAPQALRHVFPRVAVGDQIPQPFRLLSDVVAVAGRHCGLDPSRARPLVKIAVIVLHALELLFSPRPLLELCLGLLALSLGPHLLHAHFRIRQQGPVSVLRLFQRFCQVCQVLSQLPRLLGVLLLKLPDFSPQLLDCALRMVCVDSRRGPQRALHRLHRDCVGKALDGLPAVLCKRVYLHRRRRPDRRRDGQQLLSLVGKIREVSLAVFALDIRVKLAHAGVSVVCRAETSLLERRVEIATPYRVVAALLVELA